MTVNERIKKALSGFGLPVKPDRYSGDSESYFVFNYTTMGALFADDTPQYERYLVQVHYFCPMGANTLSTRKDVKRLLFEAGFTWPDEINAGDSSMQKSNGGKQHFAFECEIEEGVVLNG